MAILGLQERLARTFETVAAYGLFAAYFSRGLLWRRDGGEPMKSIEYPVHRYVPSWSWLSRLGPIKYMDLGFEQIHWAFDDLEGPFPHQTKGRNLESLLPQKAKTASRTFAGVARKMHVAKSEMNRVVLDDSSEFHPGEFHCVVIGRDKSKMLEGHPVIYALAIRAAGNPLYGQFERVGVATLSQIEVEVKGHWVTIQ